METETSPKLRIPPDFTLSAEYAAILRIFEEHPGVVLTVRKFRVLADQTVTTCKRRLGELVEREILEKGGTVRLSVYGIRGILPTNPLVAPDLPTNEESEPFQRDSSPEEAEDSTLP